MGLTSKGIERLKREPGRYADGRGLYLQVRSATSANWLFRYERHGREHWLGLGPLHTFTLAEARHRARPLRQQLYEGTDPLEARKKERASRALKSAQSITFEECSDAYFDSVSDAWRNKKHRAQFVSTLRQYAYPILGQISVADIDVSLILRVLEALG